MPRPVQQHPVDLLIDLWNNRRETLPDSIAVTSTSSSIASLWNRTDPWVLIPSLLSAATAIYIVYPTLFPSQPKMFATKRPDKYTTGFMNGANDCFANSDVQALSSLPALNEYLRQMAIIREAVVESATQITDNNLHEPLATILSRLQETIYAGRVLSVWEFLQVIEKIYRSRISRTQNDAQELLQLILETLYKEYVSLRKIYNDTPSVQDAANEKGLTDFPEFPFVGELASRLRCMRCGKCSSTSFNPTMVVSLGLPEEQSISLETLLKRNEGEVIEDYSCLVCKIRYVLATSKDLVQNEDDLQRVARLSALVDTVLINDDIDPDLESFLDRYPGIKNPQMKSIVHRQSTIVKAPRILVIHLSRSLYLDTRAWRNSCKVLFDDKLTVRVDTELAKRTKGQAHDEDLDSLNPSLNPTLDDKAAIEHNEFPAETTVNVDTPANDVNSDGDPDEIEVVQHSKQKRKRKVQPVPTRFSEADYEDHFYTLRAMIRHIGQHSMGHYECYKRKPVYYKSRETGEYYCKETTIDPPQKDIVAELVNIDNAVESTETEVSDTPARRGSFSKFRSRVSSVVGSKPHSLSDDSELSSHPKHGPKRDKKLASCVKQPFWKIGDDHITECTESDVLGDNSNVYILFYEMN